MPPAKTTVEAPGSTVPAVYVQLWVVRRVPPMVSVPDGLLIETSGRSPAAVVEAPLNAWAPAPSKRSVLAPPEKVDAVVTSPWASRVPAPLSVPAVSVARPGTVIVPLFVTVTTTGIVNVPARPRVVPAAIVTAPRSSRLPSACEPLIVPPAWTRVDPAAFIVPAVYVQLLVVRIVPARVSVPEGLLMTRSGRSPAAVVAAPVNVWAPAPLRSRVAAPPVYAEAWLTAPWAARVPVPLRAPAVRVTEPVAVRVSPALMVFAPAAKTMLLNVSLTATSSVAAAPPNDTVPLPALNAPPVSVKLPDTENVALVEVNVPPGARLNGPLRVIAAAPPTKKPPDWLNPDAPIVTAAACVIVPG